MFAVDVVRGYGRSSQRPQIPNTCRSWHRKSLLPWLLIAG
jgi:hypothetical protein